MRNKEADVNRIDSLKRDLESKNFYSIKNSSLEYLKDKRNFDIVNDIQKKLEINNEYDNLINLNNKKARANNQIENNKHNNITDNLNERIGRRLKNNKIDDYSKNNFMLKVDQLNYNSESRNMNNNSNNMLNVFESNNNSAGIIKKDKKINYENIRNKEINIRNYDGNLYKIDNKNYGETNEENLKNDENAFEMARLRMMDPLGKLKNN